MCFKIGSISVLIIMTMIFGSCGQRPAASEIEPQQTSGQVENLEPENVSEDREEYHLEQIQNRPYRYFSKSESSWVGDVMPYYEDGVFHIYFLDDARDDKPQFHPFALASTENLVDYDYKGIVIPCGGLQEQDIALGTGSVFKARDGRYHAFYTGHNYNYPKEDKPREAMMHAVSDDMVHFTKIPEDTFYAPDGYERDDFRDPYVLWVEEAGEYWMLVTARKDNKGVAARFSSQDLSQWKLEAPLFDTGEYGITECPDLFKLGDKWYLIFSTNWMTFYRYADSPNGPWIKPEYERWDGRGFYAAKTGGDEENRVLFGWIPTKYPAADSGKWEWAGNMAAMQLKQNQDGTLNVELPEAVGELFAGTETAVTEALGFRGTASMEDGKLTISGDKEVCGATLGTVHDKMLITADITLSEGASWAGFAANYQHELDKAFGINFDQEKGQMKFLEGQLRVFRSARADAWVPVPIPAGERIQVKILIDRDICVIYYNDAYALSTRMYKLQGSHWGFYAINGNLTVENIRYGVLE